MPSARGQQRIGLRVGLYGGAFDPPHYAHIALAQAAVAQLGLDVLYIIPTGQPWMKQRRLSAGAHRLAMAQQAFAHLPRVQVDDCELQRSGTTYTIDTLRELQARPAHAGKNVDWFLVMGEDLLHTLPQWQRAKQLLREVTVAVLPRTQAATATAAPVATATAAANTATAAATTMGPTAPVLQAPPGVRVVPLHLPASSADANPSHTVSATSIRQGVQQRAALAPHERQAWLQTLVPQAVAQYIEDHRLYFTPHAS